MTEGFRTEFRLFGTILLQQVMYEQAVMSQRPGEVVSKMTVPARNLEHHVGDGLHGEHLGFRIDEIKDIPVERH
ncbi:hypothetical protein AD929_04180 [Gluconobacter potus]|uniref:Uncharacterized protein n=1 Tax=Gluconobacter potus TaxID=2724927 RepID=A0A149QY00_9PROT|nr:hypothetical protein AD929_04180 [Gluconobacter potus]